MPFVRSLLEIATDVDDLNTWVSKDLLEQDRVERGPDAAPLAQPRNVGIS